MKMYQLSIFHIKMDMQDNISRITSLLICIFSSVLSNNGTDHFYLLFTKAAEIINSGSRSPGVVEVSFPSGNVKA